MTDQSWAPHCIETTWTFEQIVHLCPPLPSICKLSTGCCCPSEKYRGRSGLASLRSFSLSLPVLAPEETGKQHEMIGTGDTADVFCSVSCFAECGLHGHSLLVFSQADRTQGTGHVPSTPPPPCVLQFDSVIYCHLLLEWLKRNQISLVFFSVLIKSKPTKPNQTRKPRLSVPIPPVSEDFKW